jgi:hypothetical protein
MVSIKENNEVKNNYRRKTMTDYDIQELVEYMQEIGEFVSVEEAMAFVEETARDHDLSSHRSGNTIFIAHFGLAIYFEDGDYYLRVLEDYEL